jgi:GT2 family glycosyltransferase
VDKALSLSAQVQNALRSDLSGCEWVVIADQPLLLEPQALGWLAHAAVQDGTEAVFCDEDIAHARAPGDPLRWFFRNPWLKDAADPELLDQGVPFGNLVAVRRDVLERVLAAPGASEGAPQEWWLHLHRALMERGGVRHGPNALASQFDKVAALRPAPQDVRSDPSSVPGQVARCGAYDSVLSVIIPTKDRLDLLQPCLESLRATAARPDRLSITIVDNGSVEPQTLAFLVQAQKDGTVQRVLRRDEPFNWSRLNNVAVAEGDAPLLAFVNNDIEMISTGWDNILRWHLSRADIGAVGARLLYPDRTVQHAGMVLGTEGSGAEHEGRGAAASDPGPRGRWKQRRTVPAVTGALLGCRRDAFEQVGGFDALRFGIWFSDVDFCLRLRAAGLRVIYEPAIEAYHHESKSLVSEYGDTARGAYIVEAAVVMRERLGSIMPPMIV